MIEAPKRIYAVASHGPTNAIVALLVAAYLGVVIYRGNLASLWDATQKDVISSGFWKWAVALLILYWLASTPSLNPVFGPLLIVAILGMLIYAADRNPQGLKQLSTFFAPSAAAPTANVGGLP